MISSSLKYRFFLSLCHFSNSHTSVCKMSRLMTKPTKWPVCLAKTQVSLDIRPVWPESSLCAQWIQAFFIRTAKTPEQTGRMPRLIWVFAGRTCHFVGFFTRRLNCWWFMLARYLGPDNWNSCLFHYIYTRQRIYFGPTRFIHRWTTIFH